MGPSDKASFAMGVASIRWEPLFRLNTCEEKYLYYHTIINSIVEHFFPIKTVTRHTADKPWITDMSGTLYVKGTVLLCLVIAMNTVYCVIYNLP